MFLPGATTLRLIFSSVVILMVVISIQTGEAKRGCAAFGHSCYGGHGKRSDSSSVNLNEIQVPDDFRPSLNDARAIIVRDDDFRSPIEISVPNQEDNGGLALILPLQYQDAEYPTKISPIFWKWLMNSYRKDLHEMKI